MPYVEVNGLPTWHEVHGEGRLWSSSMGHSAAPPHGRRRRRRWRRPVIGPFPDERGCGVEGCSACQRAEKASGAFTIDGGGWLLVVPLGCAQRDRCVAGVGPTWMY